jgi:hypothetical protein
VAGQKRAFAPAIPALHPAKNPVKNPAKNADARDKPGHDE